MGGNKSGQNLPWMYAFLRTCYSNTCTKATVSTGSTFNHECNLLVIAQSTFYSRKRTCGDFCRKISYCSEKNTHKQWNHRTILEWKV